MASEDTAALSVAGTVTSAAVVMVACAIVFASAVRSAPVYAATFKIVAADRVGEGFNDETARAPVGGNPRNTLGAQRLFVGGNNHACIVRRW